MPETYDWSQGPSGRLCHHGGSGLPFRLDLKNLRQYGSKHPDHHGIEVLPWSTYVSGTPIESTIFRSVALVVTEMPFADPSIAVSGGGEQVGQSGCPFPEFLAWHLRMGYSVSELMHAGQQSRACGRAGRTHIEILQPHTLLCEAIDIRRLQQWVAIDAPVAVALVVSKDEQDVWFGGVGRVSVGCHSRI